MLTKFFADIWLYHGQITLWYFTSIAVSDITLFDFMFQNKILVGGLDDFRMVWPDNYHQGVSDPRFQQARVILIPLRGISWV